MNRIRKYEQHKNVDNDNSAHVDRMIPCETGFWCSNNYCGIGDIIGGIYGVYVVGGSIPRCPFCSHSMIFSKNISHFIEVKFIYKRELIKICIKS